MDALNSASLFNVNSSPIPNSSTTETTGKTPMIKSEPTIVGNSLVAMGAANVTAASPSVIAASSAKGSVTSTSVSSDRKILDKRRLGDLVKEVDPLLLLDDDVEEMILQIADDFIDNAVSLACELAKHRKSNTLETKDLHLILERHYNMCIPGLGADELRPYKKAHVTDAHKQRMALIKKTMKKF